MNWFFLFEKKYVLASNNIQKIEIHGGKPIQTKPQQGS